MNTVPETTATAIGVDSAIPELKGKFDGLSFRVPNITGSISDITFIAKRATTVEEIAQILTDAAASPRWQGILQVTRDQLVSSDIIGQQFGATVPLDLIKVIDGDMVKGAFVVRQRSRVRLYAHQARAESGGAFIGGATLELNLP